MKIAVDNLVDLEKYLINNATNLTNKKLQKLLYFTQVWFVTLNNNKEEGIKTILFSSPIIAWRHGPVVIESYERYEQYLYHYLQVDENYESNLEVEIVDFLNNILNAYDKYDGDELESITHQHSPWKDAFSHKQNNVISIEAIFDFYTERIA